MNYKIVTGVSEEVVSLAEIRNWCRIDDDMTDDDAMLQRLIRTARRQAEKFTGQFIGIQSIIVAYDEFPCGSALAIGYPVRSITSLTYVDPDDVTQTMSAADYTLDDFSKPSYLILRSAADWPDYSRAANAVQIALSVGYAPDGDSPPAAWPIEPDIKTAICLAAAEWYENRENAVLGTIVSELPEGVRRILQPHRIELGV